MTKKLLIIFTNLLLITIFIYVFIYSKIVKETIIFGINLWVYNLIPSLFPFLLISKLLIKYNIVNKLNNIVGNYISLIFKISKSSSFVVILSIITGFPSGSIYIKDLLDKNQISLIEANKLITFTSFSSPMFVISVIGENLLKSKTIGIQLYIIHLITGLLVGYLFKNDFQSKYHNNSNNIDNNTFIKSLMSSINESFMILINMLGIILFFLIIISIINTFLPNNIFSLIFKGLLEISSGVVFISSSSLSLKLKAAIIGAIISFNGLSVHYQVKNIIEDTRIEYKYFLIARIIHSILCFIITYIVIM